MRHNSFAIAFLAWVLPMQSGAQEALGPDAVWQAWRDGAGFVTATGSAEMGADDVLTVDGPEIRIGALMLDAERIRMLRDGDGTRIDLPDTFTLSQGDISALVTAPDLDLIAAGTPSDPTYVLTTPTLRAVLSGPSVAGTLTAEDLAATIAPSTTEASAESLTLASDDGTFEAARSGVALSGVFYGPQPGNFLCGNSRKQSVLGS